MSTSKRDEQPRHFHMGVPLSTKEQDLDDERNCLMGYCNKIPNNIYFHLKDIEKILNSTGNITIVGTKIGSISANDY